MTSIEEKLLESMLKKKEKGVKVKQFKEVYRVKQEEHEEVNDFYERVIVLKHKNKLQDEDIKNIFILGLKRDFLKIIEEMFMEEPIEEMIRKIERETRRSKKVKERIGSRKREKTWCWRCGEEEHQAFNCPAHNSQCKLCKKVGHIPKMCNKRRI